MKNKQAKVWLATASGIAVLVVAEFACRAFYKPEWRRVHEEIVNWTAEWKGDFFRLPAQLGVNSDGLRDVEHAAANTNHAFRVACLGDSVTFGYRVPWHYAYPTHLQRELESQGRRIEVFNIALPGWSPRQASIAWREIARKYQPNVVILGICLNDVAEMHNNLTKPSAWRKWLFKHSALVRCALRPHQREIADVQELFEEPRSKRVQSGWALLEEEIRQLRDSVSQTGARFILVVFPFRVQVLPDAPPPLPQERLRKFAGEANIPFLDMLPVLRPHGAKAFMDYDHLSPLGNALTAHALIHKHLQDNP